MYQTALKSHHQGFTLAELLVALGVFSVIASFTIPKVLTNIENTKKYAVFKETISAVQAALQEGKLTGALPDTPTGGQVYTYFATKLNYLKACPSAIVTQGCSTAMMFGNGAGFLMHNGAVVAIHANPNTSDLYMDYNAGAGSNNDGDDELTFIMDSSYCGVSQWQGYTGPCKTSLLPFHAGSIAAPNNPIQNLYRQVFK
jgi:prepilin-type N-terminal cleavage/methylation domain-containing protein